MEKPEYKTLGPCCESPAEGAKLAAALGENYKVLYEDYNEHGYGHHDGNAVFETADGKYIHAECGGCSCYGSGSWEYCDTREDAIRLIPMDAQERLGLR